MYVHEIEFGVVSEKFHLWAPHAHNNLSVMSRKEGLIMMRLFRDRKTPNRWFSHRVWKSKTHSDAALASPEVQLAVKTNPELGLSAGFKNVVREFELIDFVFGLEGPDAYRMREGFEGFCYHIDVHVPKEVQSQWHPYRRNSASVFARQPGLLSYEIARDLHNPEMFLVMRSFETREAAMCGPEDKPTEEVKLVVKPATDYKLYAKARGSIYAQCDVWDMVYGPGAKDALKTFMKGLKPPAYTPL